MYVIQRVSLHRWPSVSMHPDVTSPVQFPGPLNPSSPATRCSQNNVAKWWTNRMAIWDKIFQSGRFLWALGNRATASGVYACVWRSSPESMWKEEAPAIKSLWTQPCGGTRSCMTTFNGFVPQRSQMTASSAPRDSVGHGTPRELWEIIRFVWSLWFKVSLWTERDIFPQALLIKSSSLVVAVRYGSFGEDVRLRKQRPLQWDQLISELRCPCYHVETEQDDGPFMIHKEDKNPQGLFYTLGFYTMRSHVRLHACRIIQEVCDTPHG